MKHIDKICNPRNNGVNVCNGLDRKKGKALEVECYKLLDSIHFPKLISYDKPNIIRMEHKGTSLDKLRKKIKVIDYKKQINKITEEFRTKKIVHLDIISRNNLGKNTCVSKDGIISIIDFDIAVIDDNPLTETLKNKYNKLLAQTDDKNDIYDIVKKQITNIIEKHKYLILK